MSTVSHSLHNVWLRYLFPSATEEAALVMTEQGTEIIVPTGGNNAVIIFASVR